MAAVVLLRVVVRLARVERDAVGNDCGGDAGTPDSCSWIVTCRRVLAMVSWVESRRDPGGRRNVGRQIQIETITVNELWRFFC